MRVTPLPCTEVQAHIPLFVGGDLEDPADELVRSHVAVCSPCADQVAASEAARRALLTLAGELENAGPVPELWGGVRESLIAEGLLTEASRSPLATAPSPTRRVRWGGTRTSRWVAFVGSAAAAAVLATTLWVGGTDPRTVGAETGLAETTPAVGTDAEVRLAAQAGEPTAPVVPVAGGLRKALPGEARMRDNAVPYGIRLRGSNPGPTRAGENVLVGHGVR